MSIVPEPEPDFPRWRLKYSDAPLWTRGPGLPVESGMLVSKHCAVVLATRSCALPNPAWEDVHCLEPVFSSTAAAVFSRLCQRGVPRVRMVRQAVGFRQPLSARRHTCTFRAVPKEKKKKKRKKARPPSGFGIDLHGRHSRVSVILIWYAALIQAPRPETPGQTYLCAVLTAAQ